MAQLVELDIAEQAAGHGKHEGGIEKNQACLANMGVVEQNQASGKNAGGKTVPRLPHDKVYHRDGQGAKEGREGAEGHVGNLVRNVGVANVLEVKVAIEANQPANKGKEELAERRVHVEEVGLFEIVRGEL